MMAQDNNSFNNDLNEDEEECPLMHENAGKQAVFKKVLKKLLLNFAKKKARENICMNLFLN